MNWSNIALLPIVLSVFFTTFSYSAPAPHHAVDNRTDFVPFEKWHCGSADWDKWLSHEMVLDACPTRMYESNLCCVVHDICYTEEGKTQQECDETFCFCLSRTLVNAVPPHHAARPRTDRCSDVSESFCRTVQMFGGAAHSSAQKPSTHSTTSSPPSTTTAFPPASAERDEEQVVGSPNRIGEFIAQNISLECYDDELSECIEGLHSCVYTTHNISAVVDHTNCSRRFCSCISARLPGEAGGERAHCHAAIEQVCHESGSVKLVKISAKGDSNDRVLLSAININYPSPHSDGGERQPALSSWQWIGVATLFSVTLVLILYIAYKFFKVCKNRKVSHCLPTDAPYPVSHVRRHTLPGFHPYCEPHYDFGEDAGRSHHHHQKHNLHLGVNFLHRPQGLPINSSKSLLLSEGENCSSCGKLSSSSPGNSSTPSMISSQE